MFIAARVATTPKIKPLIALIVATSKRLDVLKSPIAVTNDICNCGLDVFG